MTTKPAPKAPVSRLVPPSQAPTTPADVQPDPAIANGEGEKAEAASAIDGATLTTIAETAYNAERNLRLMHGDQSMPTFASAGGHIVGWWLCYAEIVVADPTCTPAHVHETWRARITEDGWTHGGHLDFVRKWHPDHREWGALTSQERNAVASRLALMRAVLDVFVQ